MRELLGYMKVLSEELHQSSARTPQQLPSSQHAYADNDVESDLVASPRYPETPQHQASLQRIQRQLQNQLGTPLVVVASDTGYAGNQRSNNTNRLSTPRRRPAAQGHRYSPERYRTGPYEMCETYTRRHHEPLPEELSETEGYLDVLRPGIQQRGQGSRVEPSVAANISRRAQAGTRKTSGTRQHQMNARPRTSFRTGDADRFFDDEQLPVRRAAEVKPTAMNAPASVRRSSRKNTTPLRGNVNRQQQSGRAVSPNYFGQALDTINEQVNTTQTVGNAAPSSDDAVTHNANLRAAALRRLAEVVSNTHVTGNRSQFY